MPVRTEYDHEFFAVLNDEPARSARALVPTFLDLFQPSSVIDIGGGAGAWTAEFLRAGITDALVVDGNYVPAESLLVPPEHFTAHDLTEPLDLGRRFDVGLSLEVAEHLPERAAETFVASLCRHSDLIIFSAAIPGQGGTRHLNERWPTYWRDLFAAHNFALFDILRGRVWHDQRIGFWFRQNLLVFAAPGAASKAQTHSALPPIDLVHPEQFAHRTAMFSRSRGIKESSRDLAVAVKRRARGTLGLST